MDQFRESLDRIDQLTDEELKNLKESVRTQFDTIGTQDPTPDVVQEMSDLVSAAELVQNESNRRVQEAAALSEAAAEAQARMAGLADEEAPDVTASDAPAEAEEGVVEEEAPEEEASEIDKTIEEDPSAAADDAPAEGSPAAEAAKAKAEEEAPAEEAKEEAPEAEEDDSEDNDPSDDTLSEEDKKKLQDLSSDATETTSLDVPVESELSTAEAVEAPVTETVAENAPEAEASAEAHAEAELATEEVASEPTVTEEASSEDTTAQTEEPVTASSTPEFQAPEDLAPEIAEETEVKGLPTTIVAGADIPGVAMGSELPNLRAVAQALMDRKKAMGRTTGGNGEQALVASIRSTYPEDRLLNSADFDGNAQKIEAVNKVVSAPGAIVAAGGFLAPVPVRYELFGFGTTERPVKDSLAVFGADRGGLRYITPPVLTDLNGAVSLWTKDDDIAALTDPNVTKPCIRVAAGEEITVEVEAIPLCLTFGNMGARSYPELVERHTELGMILHARFAETRLLTRIGSLSTQVSATAQLGAVRDILGQVDRAASGYRNRHRIADDTPLRVIFPAWFKDALRSDIAKQIPGDGLDDTLALAEAQINSWFSARYINVTWTIDGETGQIQGAQADGALNNYPANVIWYLFAEGTFLFLDQGILDLGLVRDSMLNSTNDYKIFLETFEGVAKVGVESLRVTSELKIRGSSSATTEIV